MIEYIKIVNKMIGCRRRLSFFVIRMVPKGHWKKNYYVSKQRQEQQDNTEDNWLLDSNYQPEDIHTIAKEFHHLNNKQIIQLKTYSKNIKIFSQATSYIGSLSISFTN